MYFTVGHLHKSSPVRMMRLPLNFTLGHHSKFHYTSTVWVEELLKIMDDGGAIPSKMKNESCTCGKIQSASPPVESENWRLQGYQVLDAQFPAIRSFRFSHTTTGSMQVWLASHWAYILHLTPTPWCFKFQTVMAEYGSRCCHEISGYITATPDLCHLTDSLRMGLDWQSTLPATKAPYPWEKGGICSLFHTITWKHFIESWRNAIKLITS